MILPRTLYRHNKTGKLVRVRHDHDPADAYVTFEAFNPVTGEKVGPILRAMAVRFAQTYSTIQHQAPII